MQEAMIDHNIIIRESSRNLRALGRNSLAGKWKVSILAVVVYLILNNIPPIILNAIFGTNVAKGFVVNGDITKMDIDMYTQLYNSLPDYCLLAVMYTVLVAGALELGLCLFFIAVFRKYDVLVSDVFLGFEKFGKALGLYLFQVLFVTLWTFLFIIPGIIAAIRYSMAFFVLADDPTKSIRECMNESKRMMRGNKAKYFCLSLSFIGWAFLSVLPSALIETIGDVISVNDIVTGFFSAIAGLVMAPLLAYMYASYVGFYEILAGHLKDDTMPIPVTVEEAQEMHAEIVAQNEKSEDTENGAETVDKSAEAAEEVAEDTEDVSDDGEIVREDGEVVSDELSDAETDGTEQPDTDVAGQPDNNSDREPIKEIVEEEKVQGEINEKHEE